MKTVITLLLSIYTLTTVAQTDTIYANDKKAVALFFPTPIRQGIVGKSNFTFSYNKEEAQYFGLLQASPGKESNLLAITNDGQVYSYILKYSDSVQKLNYFVKKSKSIGNEKPVLKEKEKKNVQVNLSPTKEAYYQKFSHYLLGLKREEIATKRKRGMRLQLQKIFYNASEVYLVLEIANKSGIDFEVDYLKIYKVSGTKRRKASMQKSALSVRYTHNTSSIIHHENKIRFVYVLPKFVLGAHEKLWIELKELHGSRTLLLKTKN